MRISPPIREFNKILSNYIKSNGKYYYSFFVPPNAEQYTYLIVNDKTRYLLEEAEVEQLTRLKTTYENKKL